MSLCNHIKCSGFKIEFISFCGNIESQSLNSPSIAFSILTRLHLKGGGGRGGGVYKGPSITPFIVPLQSLCSPSLKLQEGLTGNI